MIRRPALDAGSRVAFTVYNFVILDLVSAYAIRRRALRYGETKGFGATNRIHVSLTDKLSMMNTAVDSGSSPE